MEVIEGTVEEIIYRNETNGYTVCTVVEDEIETTLVGYMPFLNKGETLKAYGNWVEHPEYGRQLKVERYEKIMPGSLDGLEKYIGSGIVRGIGPVAAAKIIAKFGKETSDIIYGEPVRLAQVKGISIEKAIELGRVFQKQKTLADIIMLLQQYGIGSSYSVKIHRLFGDATKEIITENPYRLIEHKLGLNFRTVDNLARNMNIEIDPKQRIGSGVRYILAQAAGGGHTFVPEDRLAEYAIALMDVDEAQVLDAIVSLTVEGVLYADRACGKNRIYLRTYHEAEEYVASKLIHLNTSAKIENLIDPEEVCRISRAEGIILNDLQLDAVSDAMRHGVMIITGGPGTGKTTIIRAIIKLLKQKKFQFALAAPTGRAAKRMSETSGCEAKTIHRLLEVGYSDDDDEPVFERNEHNPIDADVIIIDEMSMVDIILMKHLLKAVNARTRLIMVGDSDQLPSVGPGNVLKDLIACGRLNVVKLTEIFRQAAESNIIVNAHKINRGDVPVLNEKDKDFFFIQKNGMEEGVEAILQLCVKRLPETYGYDPIKHIQVLTPTKKGPCGTVSLNARLQEMINPPSALKNERPAHGYIFREGDRVMQTTNNYNLKWRKNTEGEFDDGLGVFNGDTGMITAIEDGIKTLTVLFDDDKIVEYGFDQLDDIDLSYAITVHKSQGSEFSAIVMPMFPGPPVLMTRNLLYTAVSRARELVVMVGQKSVLEKMVWNLKEDQRFSSLKDKMLNAL